MVKKKDEYINIDFRNYKSWIITMILSIIILLLIIQKHPIQFEITETVKEDICRCECIVEHKEVCDWNISYSQPNIRYINFSNFTTYWSFRHFNNSECKTCWQLTPSTSGGKDEPKR